MTVVPFAATDGDRVWLFGGSQGGSPVSELWEVDLAEETWRRMEEPPGIRRGPVHAVGDRLYMIPQNCNCYSVYDPDTETWSVARRPPYAGWGGALFSIAGRLVSYGDGGDGWVNGQMYTFYPECEPGDVCD